MSDRLLVTPLSEIARDIERLHPVWASIAESFHSGRDGGIVNIVIGCRIQAQMIAASRLRALGDPILAVPHLNPSGLSKHFALPLIRLGNRYYIDSDLSASPEKREVGLGFFESPFRLAFSDMMADCIALAALSPLIERQTRCGLIDPVTQEANCVYVAGGAGCPQASMTLDQIQMRRQNKVFDWCHWTNVALRTATAPPNLLDEWVKRWRRESSATARGDEE